MKLLDYLKYSITFNLSFCRMPLMGTLFISSKYVFCLSMMFLIVFGVVIEFSP